VLDNSALDFRHDTIISDVSIPSSSINPNQDETRHLLKCMQPYREKPSQDRSKQFCAGNIYGDQGTLSDYDVFLPKTTQLAACQYKCKDNNVGR